MLFDYFIRTRAIRRGIVEAGQDTDAPDFGRGKSVHSGAPGGEGPEGADVPSRSEAPPPGIAAGKKARAG